MNEIQRSLRSLYVSQFLSAFVDNVVFFVILGLLSRRGAANPEAGMLVVQMGFLLSYIVFAPFVGTFTDKNSKGFTLLIGSLIKLAGTACLFTPLPPHWSYMIIGIGAVLYGCAKYAAIKGIAGSDTQLLLKANGYLESGTIVAILLGTVAGGFLSRTPLAGLAVCVILYLISAAATRWVVCEDTNPSLRYGESAKAFLRDVKRLFANPRARFSLLGTSSFWMVSSVLRITFLIWLAQRLYIEDTFLQSAIVGSTGIGIVAGALLAPYLTRPGKLGQTTYYGLAMFACILLALVPLHWGVTVGWLLLIGALGGLFLIPMNTALQVAGHPLVGAGKTIAIQNFTENSFMIAGIALTRLVVTAGADITLTIGGAAAVFGLLMAGLLRLSSKRSAGV